MNVLIISAFFPMPDRLGGDHRFFRLMEGIADRHRLDYLAFAPQAQVEQVGHEAVDRYRREIAALGAEVLQPGVRSVLKTNSYDAVIFQYHINALLWLKEVRLFQPRAPVVIDNGDVVYRRLHSKAEFTGTAEDFAKAEAVKREELAAYRGADGILGVSAEDIAVVRTEIPDLRSFIIPNIHPIPPRSTRQKNRNRLIFVGSFLHPPNVDGILWFVSEILPLVAEVRPEVRLQIVGYGPTPEVQALASERVEVVGYVPDTAPYLEEAYVSIAPLRFGAGVKGKIGEAMAFRLPVVTTAVGVDGFGLSPGDEILVGDSPELFAKHVIRLLNDEGLHAGMAEAGYRFIRKRFSEEAVRERIQEFLAALPSLPVKRLPLGDRLEIRVDDWMARNVRWRFGGAS